MDLLTDLLYSTARLEVATPSGRSVGTGFFFYALKEGGKAVPLLVTNKHVVAGGTQLRFLLHLEDDKGAPSPTSVPVSHDLSAVVHHPDPTVDLCGIPILPWLNATEQQHGRRVYYRTIDSDIFPGVQPLNTPGSVEDILMLGYPNGLWDTFNNLPIVRRGITATSPTMRFEGRPEFMIDAACFPGCSGSPVFMFERNAFMKEKQGTTFGRRFCFLGVLYAGPRLDDSGRLHVDPIPTTSANDGPRLMHLGLVVHAEELRKIENEVRRLLQPAQAPDASAVSK